MYQMKAIKLGSQGFTVSELGYGCMGLTSFYGAKLPDDEIISFLQKVYAKGVNFWDTANVYIYFDFWRVLRFASPIVCQEEIIQHAIEKVGRDNVCIATKTGLNIDFFPKLQARADGSPAFIRKQCEDSLRRLGVDCIDLFYLHRIDQTTPIEISMMELKKLHEEGKIKYVGLSECSAATIRRAHKVFPLTCVQLEYSLWCRGIEKEVIPTCAELGIGLVAYSPLGRGFFGGITNSGKFGKADFRAGQERMVGEAGEKNKKFLEGVQKVATEKGCTTVQLALAWLKAQSWRLNGAGLVPIPGTTKERNLISNVGAYDIDLTTEEIAALEAAVPIDKVEGSRYEPGHIGFEDDKNPELTQEQKNDLGL